MHYGFSVFTGEPSFKTAHSKHTSCLSMSLVKGARLRNSVSYSVLTNSYLKCLAKCASDHLCMTVSFDRTTKQCDISTSIVTEFSEIYLGADLAHDRITFIPVV